MPKASSAKRPCRVCRRWFLPDVRQGKRQKTCGRPECQRKWHLKLCSRWNKKNKAYFKANYLSSKIRSIQPSQGSGRLQEAIPQGRIQLHLPRDYLIDAVGAAYLVIAEYVIEQIFRHKTQPAGSVCRRAP